MDQIIVLKDGQISEVGTYRELLAQRGAFSEFLLEYIVKSLDKSDVGSFISRNGPLFSVLTSNICAIARVDGH